MARQIKPNTVILSKAKDLPISGRFFTSFRMTVLVLFCAMLPHLALADNIHDRIQALSHDGVLRLYAYHLDELGEFHYLDASGNWIEAQYQKICAILRSRGDDKTLAVEKSLIELADHLQDHFGADTVEIISGYRSADFNASLKDDGRNVAENSMHIQGKAFDIHLDEIRESELRDYLLKLGLGGVGYYGNRLMVHMDLGPVRQWQDGDFVENTEIGIFNKETTIKIRTDKLFYDTTSELKLSRDGVETLDALIVERFHRGKWGEAGVFSGSLLGLVPGKYRLVFKKGEVWQNSNEFYIKRILDKT